MNAIVQFFAVLWSPRETLRAVAKSPRFLAPLLLLMAFKGIEAEVMIRTLDPGVLRLERFERDGYADKISAEDKVVLAEEARHLNILGTRLHYTVLLRGIGFVSVLVVLPLVALIFFLIFGLGREGSLKTFFSVTAYAFVPSIFRSVASVISVFASERTQEALERAVMIGPVRFLDPESVSPLIYSIASMADVVSIWILALLVIGYGFAAKSRAGLALRIVAVGGLYCVWSAISMAMIRTSAG